MPCPAQKREGRGNDTDRDREGEVGWERGAAVAVMMTGRGGAARGVAALGKAAQAKAPQPEARPEAFTCYVAAEAKAAAALGELRGTLPNGCLKRKCIDVTESGRRIADVGEHIYVICMQCDKLRVPL